MWNQVRYLPTTSVKVHMVFERSENLDLFSVLNLHFLGDSTRIAYGDGMESWDEYFRFSWMLGRTRTIIHVLKTIPNLFIKSRNL
jgi:hypothetical protein